LRLLADHNASGAGADCVCQHGIHMDNACGACVPPRGTTAGAMDEVAELYPLWLKNIRQKTRAEYRTAQAAYECLSNKDTTYGLSLKAVADLRRQMVDVAAAFPDALAKGSDEEEPT
jgi:hypothetical protein